MKIKALFAIVFVAAAALYSFPALLNAGSSSNSHSSHASPRSSNNPSVASHPSTKVPFDGGVTLLIAAGVGIGLKKGYDKRKKQSGTSI